MGRRSSEEPAGSFSVSPVTHHYRQIKRIHFCHIVSTEGCGQFPEICTLRPEINAIEAENGRLRTAFGVNFTAARREYFKLREAMKK